MPPVRLEEGGLSPTSVSASTNPPRMTGRPGSRLCWGCRVRHREIVIAGIGLSVTLFPIVTEFVSIGPSTSDEFPVETSPTA